MRIIKLILFKMYSKIKKTTLEGIQKIVCKKLNKIICIYFNCISLLNLRQIYFTNEESINLNII
jgi:hypothetical protein